MQNQQKKHQAAGNAKAQPSDIDNSAALLPGNVTKGRLEIILEHFYSFWNAVGTGFQLGCHIDHAAKSSNPSAFCHLHQKNVFTFEHDRTQRIILQARMFVG